MTDKEELTHLIHHTELVPPVVEELVEVVKKNLPPFFHIVTQPGKPQNQITIWSQKPDINLDKSRAQATINIDVHKAIIVALFWGAIKDKPSDNDYYENGTLRVEFSDPECFDKIGTWVSDLKKLRFWW